MMAGKNFVTPKTLIFGKKWPKIHLFVKKKKTKATQITDTFTPEMTYNHILKGIFHT